MCDYCQLFADEDNYVIRCRNCNHYQVCFQNLVLLLNEPDFQMLGQLSRKVTEEAVAYPDPTLRQFLLPTPYTGAKLMLSLSELQQFNDMLFQAENEAIAQAMLNWFNV